MLVVVCVLLSLTKVSAEEPASAAHPIRQLLGERLTYDISFLWFERLAEGSIRLEQAEDPERFLITMEAKTLGVAAFFTRNRVEKFQTLAQIGADGRLQPLWHKSHTLRDKGTSKSEKITSYTYDYAARKVLYQKSKNGKVYQDEWFELADGTVLFDILSALYNLRLGFFGEVGVQRILIPTFHHKGIQEIVVEPLAQAGGKEQKFFGRDSIQTRILVDPSVFGTKGRDIFASFDAALTPRRGIIKNVIGLGDVRGTLRAGF